MSASLYIAIILVIAIIAYMIVQQILNKRAVKELDQNEFHNGLEKLKSSMLERKLTMTTVTLMVSQYSYDNVQATIPRIKKRPTGILMWCQWDC